MFWICFLGIVITCYGSPLSMVAPPQLGVMPAPAPSLSVGSSIAIGDMPKPDNIFLDPMPPSMPSIMPYTKDDPISMPYYQNQGCAITAEMDVCCNKVPKNFIPEFQLNKCSGNGGFTGPFIGGAPPMDTWEEGSGDFMSPAVMPPGFVEPGYSGDGDMGVSDDGTYPFKSGLTSDEIPHPNFGTIPSIGPSIGNTMDATQMKKLEPSRIGMPGMTFPSGSSVPMLGGMPSSSIGMPGMAFPGGSSLPMLGMPSSSIGMPGLANPSKTPIYQQAMAFNGKSKTSDANKGETKNPAAAGGGKSGEKPKTGEKSTLSAKTQHGAAGKKGFQKKGARQFSRSMAGASIGMVPEIADEGVAMYRPNDRGPYDYLLSDACTMFCAFKEMNFIVDGQYKYEEIRKNFTSVAPSEWKTSVESSIKKCSEELNKYTLNNQAETPYQCNQTAAFFMSCFNKYLYLECPTQLQSIQDTSCTKKTEILKSCDAFTNPMMLMPPPMMNFGPTMRGAPPPVLADGGDAPVFMSMMGGPNMVMRSPEMPYKSMDAAGMEMNAPAMAMASSASGGGGPSTMLKTKNNPTIMTAFGMPDSASGGRPGMMDKPTKRTPMMRNPIDMTAAGDANIQSMRKPKQPSMEMGTAHGIKPISANADETLLGAVPAGAMNDGDVMTMGSVSGPMFMQSMQPKPSGTKVVQKKKNNPRPGTNVRQDNNRNPNMNQRGEGKPPGRVNGGGNRNNQGGIEPALNRNSNQGSGNRNRPGSSNGNRNSNKQNQPGGAQVQGGNKNQPGGNTNQPGGNKNLQGGNRNGQGGTKKKNTQDAGKGSGKQGKRAQSGKTGDKDEEPTEE